MSFAQGIVDINIGSCNDEARFRAAISRAYYAAYWKARKHIERDTSYISTGGRYAHNEVIQYFFQRGRRDGSYNYVYIKLNQLYSFRVKADYQDIPEVTHKNVIDALGQAREIIKRVGQLR